MINEIEILTNELNNSNNWIKISSDPDLTIEQMKKFANKLYWRKILLSHKNLSNDFLDEMIMLKHLDMNNHSIAELISRYHAHDKNFIIKYKDKLTIQLVTINNNFKIGEIVEFLPEYKIGDGVTEIVGSDKYPFTIIGMNKTKTKLLIQRDDTKPGKDFDYYSNQNYIYIPNINSSTFEIHLRKNATWKMVNGSTKFIIGRREYYQDPSF